MYNWDGWLVYFDPFPANFIAIAGVLTVANEYKHPCGMHDM